MHISYIIIYIFLPNLSDEKKNWHMDTYKYDDIVTHTENSSYE